MHDPAATFVIETVLDDPWRRRVLELVRARGLPDGWVAAGFVRSAVWDRLSGKTTATPLPDVDVIYFDPGDTARSSEETIRRKLLEHAPDVPWSVKNESIFPHIAGILFRERPAHPQGRRGSAMWDIAQAV